jgi:hypothetical protein
MNSPAVNESRSYDVGTVSFAYFSPVIEHMLTAVRQAPGAYSVVGHV